MTISPGYGSRVVSMNAGLQNLISRCGSTPSTTNFSRDASVANERLQSRAPARGAISTKGYAGNGSGGGYCCSAQGSGNNGGETTKNSDLDLNLL